MAACALIVLVGLGYAVTRTARPALSPALDGKGTENTIMVTGTAELQAKPDTALITLGVERQAVTSREAMTAQATAMAAIEAKLKELGIAKDSIRTSQLSLYPVYSHHEREAPTLVGYRAVNTVTVTAQNLDDLGKLVDGCVAAGANQVQGISFTLKDPSKVQLQVIDRAVKDAKAKADAIAAAAGLRIRGPINITLQQGYEIPPTSRMEAIGMGDAKLETPISPGELTVRVSVQVTYRY